MRLKEIPGFIQQALARFGVDEGQVLLSTGSDVTVGGEYRRQWLVVTGRRLLTFDSLDGRAVPLRDIPIADISDVRTDSQVGCGFLEVCVKDHFIEVIRYSNTEADKFELVRNKLKNMIEGKPLGVEPEDEVDPRRCPACGFLKRGAKDTCPQCAGKRRIIGRLAKLFWPYRFWAVLMLLLVIAIAGLGFVGPFLQQILIDGALLGNWPAIWGWIGSFVGHQQWTLFKWIILVILLQGAINAVLHQAAGVLRAYVAPRFAFDLRQRLFEKLERLSVSYHDGQAVGVLMSRATNDTQQLQGLIAQLTEGFFYQIFVLVGACVIMFILDVRLASFVLMTLPVITLGSYLYYRFIYACWHRYYEERSRVSGFLNSILSGIREVKAFAQQVREKIRFSGLSGHMRKAEYTIGKSAYLFFPAVTFVGTLAACGIWYFGGSRVIENTWTIGKLVRFIAYLNMFLAPLTSLGQMSQWLTQFTAASQRIFEILDTPEEIGAPKEPVEVAVPEGAVEFENVSFGYSRHEPVLHNVGFKIRPGEYIGIAGRSGSGKTTIINLLCRFYDTESGRVLIDGKDVRTLPIEDVHREVGLVLQQPFLFRGSIVDNIVYGRPDASQEDILRAARAANAHDFIMRMPDGYDSRIGDRGQGLSGGEQQRACIARAILYNPKILILDEASSNVDTESEQAIQKALAEVAKGRTVITIAHRLSTLRNADRIFVVDRGRIAEEGTHMQLLEKRGLYYRLVQIQTQLTKGTAVDSLSAAIEAQAQAGAEAPGPVPAEPGFKGITFLEPGQAKLDIDENGQLAVAMNGQEAYRGVRCYYAFPVSDPYHYVSLRCRLDDDESFGGPDREIGILRNLWSMTTRDRQLILDTLEKRYLVHRIQRINSVNEEFGFLFFDVDTDRGHMKFNLPWAGRFVREYGESGKTILDVNDNRYVIPDLGELSRREQAMFRRYVYW